MRTHLIGIVAGMALLSGAPVHAAAQSAESYAKSAQSALAEGEAALKAAKDATKKACINKRLPTLKGFSKGASGALAAYQRASDSDKETALANLKIFSEKAASKLREIKLCVGASDTEDGEEGSTEVEVDSELEGQALIDQSGSVFGLAGTDIVNQSSNGVGTSQGGAGDTRPPIVSGTGG